MGLVNMTSYQSHDSLQPNKRKIGPLFSWGQTKTATFLAVVSACLRKISKTGISMVMGRRWPSKHSRTHQRTCARSLRIVRSMEKGGVLDDTNEAWTSTAKTSSKARRSQKG